MEKQNSSGLLSARNLSLIVLIIAMGVSGYLSYLKIDTSASPACSVGQVFDCGTVLNSVYSEILGVPIAFLGFGVNVVAFSLLLLEPRIPFLKRYAVPFVFGLLLFAFLFSVYLVYVQAVLITKYCPWCLSHEALVTIVFLLSVKRLLDWMNAEQLETEQVSD